MIVVELDADSISRTRLALSPVFEALAWLRLTVANRTHPVFGRPGPEARAALRHRDVNLLVRLLPSSGVGYVPDLLTPKPPKESVDILGQQLGAIAATDAEVVREQVELAMPSADLPTEVRTAVEDGTFAARAASALDFFWKAALDDGWRALRRTLEADLAVRSDHIAAQGLGAALQCLHPQVGWDGTTLRVDLPWDEKRTYTGAEVVLTPSALNWPRLSAQLCHPEQAVLFHAVGAAGSHVGQRHDRAVGELIGLSRSRILDQLTVPLSTQDLARLTGLTPPTVSFHLSVLHRTGLVVRWREGDRRVMYRRSPAGTALLDL